MNKPFSLFLSLRYLRPKRSFVSLITIISIGGVVLGVWVLTAVNAIMTGYGEKIQETVLGFEPHLVVTQSSLMYNWPEVLEKVKENPNVVDAAPFSHGQVVLDHGERPWVVQVQGLDPQPGPILDRLNSLIVEGRFDLSDDYVVIGKALAEELGVTVGDTVLLRSLANGRELLDAYHEGREPDNLIFPAEMEVVGIFSGGRYDFDREYVFIPLEHGQYLYKLGAAVHGVSAQLDDPHLAEPVKYDLYQRLGEDDVITTWAERNYALFETVTVERLIMYFLLSLIMMVAGFCFMATMITVTTQKRREIGMLKAVGAQVSQIVGVFVLQGLVVFAIGTGLGLTFAILFLAVRQEVVQLISSVTGIDVFSQEIYMLSEVPSHVRLVDVLSISGGAFVACVLASLLPAYFSARMDAAQALRDESTA